MSVELWGALIVAIGSVIVVALGAVFGKAKVDAEGTQLLAAAAVALVEPLKERITELEERMDCVENERNHWFTVSKRALAAHLELHSDTMPEWWKEFDPDCEEA